MVTVLGMQRSHLGQFLLGVLLSLLMLVVGMSPAMAENFDRQNLRQMDFSNQDLRGNNYTRADMAEANLSHANLQGVRLFDTTLSRANLEGANLRGATLDGARFTRANLTNAILAGAYAFDTDFRGAVIDGADFSDVLLDPKVNDALCEVAKGTNPTTGRETRETLYCP
ncbi:MAG TPA: pentapeptide repeat-containing protein [Leptolyngbyaceae cyanobacterium]